MNLTGHRDLTQWFRASFTGTAACIVLYTIFGLILVSRHAGLLSSQMQLFAEVGLEPLIAPNDPYLTAFSHRLGSALFFGFTSGVLSALLSMVFSLIPWFEKRLAPRDAVSYAVLGAATTYLTFSAELPVLSVVFGFLSPLAFFVPWITVIRRSRSRKLNVRRWLALAGAAVSPFVIFVLLGSSSFEMIRDSMITMPVMRSISNFYYDHTLLAAHVIKPLATQEQKLIAVSSKIDRIGPIPHGSLWVITSDPCGIPGRSLVVSRGGADCSSVVLDDGRPANVRNRIIEDTSVKADPNRKLRQGIGLFFYKGPLLVVPVLFMLWFALFLSNLWQRMPVIALIVLIAYLALFATSGTRIYQHKHLLRHPDTLARAILSEHESMRYLALVTFPKEFTDRELMRFSRDESPRIRLRALYEAGMRKSADFLGTFEKALDDPQLNVRTRACLALGSISAPRATDLLERAFLRDPSWYVRDYAFRALGSTRPQARIIIQE